MTATQYPVINAGTTPTVNVLDAMIPWIAYKSSGQPNATTTLVNDSILVVPLAANATYEVELVLLYNGAASGTADIKFGWTYPSGMTLAAWAQGCDTGLTARDWYLTQSSVQAAATNGTGNPLGLKLDGTLVTGVASGNLQLQWAQNTSNATATTVMTGSKLKVRRIG